MQKFILLLLSITTFISCKDSKVNNNNDDLPKVITIEKPIVAMEYGFNLDNFTVLQDTIRNGDSFGELMTNNKVDYPKIHKISEKYKDSFDVRRIRVGKPYVILKSKDTTETAQFFIYERPYKLYCCRP